MNRKKAFTLIEVLVVVAIIGLLVGILMPSLAKARGQARLTTCASQLHQVGVAMMAYMQDSRDRMPHVSYVPSIGPFPLDDKTVYFADVLKPHLKGGAKGALQCPDDKPGTTNREGVNAGKSFFETERSSYEYRWSLKGLTPAEFDKGVGPHGWRRQSEAKPNIAPATVWFARDYDNFHGKAGENGSRRYVYIDGHVSDYEN